VLQVTHFSEKHGAASHGVNLYLKAPTSLRVDLNEISKIKNLVYYSQIQHGLDCGPVVRMHVDRSFRVHQCTSAKSRNDYSLVHFAKATASGHENPTAIENKFSFEHTEVLGRYYEDRCNPK
jgi:hypothetical protein